MVDPALHTGIKFSKRNLAIAIGMIALPKTAGSMSDFARFDFAKFGVNNETKPSQGTPSNVAIAIAIAIACAFWSLMVSRNSASFNRLAILV